MAQTIVGMQTKLMMEYYKGFSKYARGKKPENKTAWVTAFTPVEILETLGISYYYPESYAAVIAASNKEQEFLAASEQEYLCKDCCSYSGCFNGSLSMQDGPRGIPPKPDVLIATNNQCNTLPGWWNTLAYQYNVPLIILDYPGETVDEEGVFHYVTRQHEHLIRQMEELSGSRLDEKRLSELIQNSIRSVEAWKEVIGYLPEKEADVATLLDDISFLITSRCKEKTSQLYGMMADEMKGRPDADPGRIPVFWTGYPLWYHPERYLSELLEGYRVAGSDYITWWNLDYSGADVFEQLFHAYNFTFLNLCQETRNSKLSKLIQDSGALCSVTLHNKSCKCDFVSARNIDIPQAEVEIDMIDRNFLDQDKARNQIDLLKETVCTV